MGVTSLKPGEIALFDRGFIDFAFLADLTARGVFFVTRSKDNMRYRVVKKRLRKPEGNLLRNDEILLLRDDARKQYPPRLGLVTALVELDGKGLVEMTFLTNNFDWAASSVAELYQDRWAIEAFFKQIEQPLKLGSFLGHNENAIKWQFRTAHLVYLLLRFLAFRSQWTHSFTRLFTTLRALPWGAFDIHALMTSCGTARSHPRLLRAPAQAYLPGIT